MSKNSTSKVVRYSRDNLPPDKTDWARIDAMTDEEVVAAALSDPDAQPLTPEQLARMRRVSRIKVLRQRLGMTQAEFAEAFHLPIATLRDWEQHRSTPDAPARALLLAIERDPEVMRRLLAETAVASASTDSATSSKIATALLATFRGCHAMRISRTRRRSTRCNDACNASARPPTRSLPGSIA